MKKLVYLASPYSHPNHYIRVARFLSATRYASVLMSEGVYIFSPISHNHPIVEASEDILPRGWDFWGGYDSAVLNGCEKLIVLCLPEWEKSEGVQSEIKIAKELNLLIDYVKYDITPTFEDMVALALQMEIQVAPTLARSAVVEGSSNSSRPATFSSTYDSSGICIDSTNVCSKQYTLLHGI